MSKTIFAKAYDKEFQYEDAKRKQRKEDRQFRDQRKSRKSAWSNTVE